MKKKKLLYEILCFLGVCYLLGGFYSGFYNANIYRFNFNSYRYL